MKFILYILISVCMFAGCGIIWPAYAETTPGESCSVAGQHRHSSGPEADGDNAFMVCDGGTWRAVLGYNNSGSLTVLGNLGCNADEVLQFSGTVWTCGTVEGVGRFGPSDCRMIGDDCNDGTIFAGAHPVSGDLLFVPPEDQGSSVKWRSSGSADDINPDSVDDGRANHENVITSFSVLPAMQLCEELSIGSHSDWYLPSQIELYYLWTMHETIESRGNTSFLNGYYWSSSENSPTVAWRQNFENGAQSGGSTKTSLSYGVRCMRR